MSTAVPASGLLPETWRVHLPVFEGPLDLLLQLCRLNRVAVTEIPVATVCDQFHEYLGLMEQLDLDVAGDYIYVAALLIHLKSRSLLPSPTRTEEPEEDPREELVQRLLEYQRLKEAAQAMAEIDGLRRGIWTRDVRPDLGTPEDGGEPALELADVSLYDLLAALRDTLQRYEREHPEPIRLSGETFSVREQFERLLAALTPGRPLDFLHDLRSRSCRAEVVAAFLAVLELARMQLVRLHATDGGDILLHRTTRSVDGRELEALQ